MKTAFYVIFFVFFFNQLWAQTNSKIKLDTIKVYWDNGSIKLIDYLSSDSMILTNTMPPYNTYDTIITYSLKTDYYNKANKKIPKKKFISLFGETEAMTPNDVRISKIYDEWAFAETKAQTRLDSLCKSVNFSKLNYDTSDIVIKYTIANLPASKSKYYESWDTPKGVNAYILKKDSLQLFHVLKYDLVQLDRLSKEVNRFHAEGNRLSDQMMMFLQGLKEKEIEKNIFLDNVYIQDSNKNILKFKGLRKIF